MSSDNQTFNAPVGTAPPKKSRFLLFGGIGCALLMLLCGGGLLVGGFFMAPMIQKVMAEISSAQAMIESSEEVQAELGAPLNVAPPAIEQQGQGAAVGTGTVSGPNGSGSYTINLKVEGTTFTTESIVVEANGKTINVDNDMEDLDIDLGDGF